MDENEKRIKFWKDFDVKANGLTLQRFLEFCDEWEEICAKFRKLAETR